MITKLVLIAVLIGTITGYDNSSGAYPYEGITASGEHTHLGICACAEWPFGTVFVIEDLGTFVCQDRGGLVRERNQIDLWFPTYRQAKEQGVWTRWIKVYRRIVVSRGLREE